MACASKPRSFAATPPALAAFSAGSIQIPVKYADKDRYSTILTFQTSIIPTFFVFFCGEFTFLHERLQKTWQNRRQELKSWHNARLG